MNNYIKNTRHIIINNQVKCGRFLLSAKEEILHNEIVIVIREDRITICRATAMSEKTYKPTIGKDGWCRVGISGVVQPGRFFICEDESTADRIVVFFEDKA